MQKNANMENECIAIVLAAGQGKRMGSKIQKQYLEILDKPVLFYSLDTFQKSNIIDEIILVVGTGQIEYCKKEIVDKYKFDKVTKIVEGGTERYFSVWNGLNAISSNKKTIDRYVFIHDGARPLVTEEILTRGYNEVKCCKACVIGMPVKDTIKIADEKGYVDKTPKRDLVWTIQTPQIFEVNLIKKAYELLMSCDIINVTDDAMVLETMLHQKAKLVKGSYENIKITTPEDLKIAEIFAKKIK